MVGDEAKLKGNDVVYAPTINLCARRLGAGVREPRRGPFLTARMGGVDPRRPGQGVIANVKHFAVNNQEGAERADGTVAGSRYKVDARVDERTLVELYLPQFEAAVKEGHAGSVMCSTTASTARTRARAGGSLRRCCANAGLPGLRPGRLRRPKHVGSGLRAGLDFEPFPFVDFDGGEVYAPAAVQAALDAHRTTQAAVDRAVRNPLRTLFAYGFFDRAPTSTTSRASTAPRTPRRAAWPKPAPCCCRTSAARSRSTRSG